MAFQSCPFWWQATHSIATTTSDFSIPPSSPSSVSFTAMSVIGYGWTWQLPTMPTTYWLSSGNKAFALSPRMQINHALLRFGWSKISGPRSKKAIYDGGWEATSILALKQSIKEKVRQILLPPILCLFNLMAVCAQDGYWAVYC